MLIAMTGFQGLGPLPLSPFQRFASQLCDRGERQVCLSVRNGDEEGTKKKRGRENERGERANERAGEREADGAGEENVVAVCQPLIRALVCPLWAGVRD